MCPGPILDFVVDSHLLAVAGPLGLGVEES